MRRHALLYGLVAGVLIAGLRLIEYRWLVVEHSIEIYGGLVAVTADFRVTSHGPGQNHPFG